MLRFLRRRAKVVLWWLIVLLVPLFILWGVGGAILAHRRQPRAGTLYGRSISLETYLESLGAVERQAVLSYGPAVREWLALLDLPQQAWDRLMLLEEARRRKIRVDDGVVIGTIAAMPVFHDAGHFDPTLYRERLHRLLNVTPRAFEHDIRQTLTLATLREQILADVRVTPEEVETAYREAYEQVQAAYVRFDPATFTPDQAPSDAALQEYFATHPDAFQRPERLALEYLGVDTGPLEESLTIAETEIVSYYDTHADAFRVPPADPAASPADASAPPVRPLETVRDEIVRQLRRLRAQERARATINDISDHLVEPQDFVTASDQAGLPIQRTGFFSRDEVVPELATLPAVRAAAWTLEPGEISQPIHTDTGSYLVWVAERQEPAPLSFDEARPLVERAVGEQDARRLAEEAARTARTRWQEARQTDPQRSLEALAATDHLTVHTTPLFTRVGGAAGLLGEPAVLEAAFALRPGELSQPVVTQEGVLLLELRQRVPADPAGLDARRAALAEETLENKQEAQFSAWLDTVRQAARLESRLDPALLGRQRPAPPDAPE